MLDLPDRCTCRTDEQQKTKPSDADLLFATAKVLDTRDRSDAKDHGPDSDV